MTTAFGGSLRAIQSNHSVLSIRSLSIAILVAGCGGNDGAPTTGGVGGAASANGGSAVIGSGGTAFGGASNATGGSTGRVQSGGTPGQGGAQNQGGTSVGGAVVSSGGTPSSGGVVNQGGANVTGGNKATGGSGVGGSQSGGNTVTGGKATGGSGTAGGPASTGGSGTAGAKATGGATTTGGSAGTLAALTIYIAGDSTVSTYTDTAATNDQAGWGQMLHEIFNTKVTVVNRAAGGRTAYWFYLEGAVTNILNAIKPGDYFFIQFGTNDQNTTATFTVNGTTYPRYAAAATDFKTQLKQYYLDPTKAKGAIPVLVTPPPRNSAYCNGGNGLGAYATAMKELGAVENVAVVDNNLLTFNFLKAICPQPTTAAAETFFKNDAGTIDGTHFQENGARKMAGFIATEVKRLNLGLAGYLL